MLDDETKARAYLAGLEKVWIVPELHNPAIHLPLEGDKPSADGRSAADLSMNRVYSNLWSKNRAFLKKWFTAKGRGEYLALDQRVSSLPRRVA